MASYLYMLLTLIFSSAVGLLYKLAGIRRYNVIVISLLYFAVASAALFLYILFFASFQLDVISICTGLLGGLCAFGATWAILNALRFGKVSTSWTIFGLSLVIPTMASIIFWGERLTLTKGLGFVLVCISIALIGKDR